MKRSTTMTTAALLTGLTLFVTACTGGAGGSDGKKDEKNDSSSSSGTGGSGGGADADNALKLRKCLRDNGVDAPDPKPGEDPRGMTLGAGADQEVLKKAMEKCGMQAPGSGGETSQAEKDKALKQAKCMRDNGFDMPDPEFNGNMRSGVSIPDGADKDKFMAQLNKCSGDQ
ncbi:hypothetical protein [Streptomyces sp. NBC_01264]|uniref:hypothetical protein n=1 Tax=Streptomyces sp. NBC_01264 TaxID=2903804 RepID=UPI002257FD24|nr:hypothetical protein [Streptomyces sp. NBC_01264]MCX4779078.1 hypothetical protein [Streptomyces sp. NBC_01264]